MIDVVAVADHLIQLFRQSLPWLAQTAKTAVATQAIREAWEQVKGKLFSPGGKEAVQKVEAQPDKDRNWDALKIQLLDALEEDEKFREEMSRLVEKAAPKGGIQQTVTGNENDQAAIQNSQGATITQSRGVK